MVSPNDLSYSQGTNILRYSLKGAKHIFNDNFELVEGFSLGLQQGAQYGGKLRSAK
jgi:hypothetical protein